MKKVLGIIVFACLFFLAGIQTSYATTDRIEGVNRFSTAVEISKSGWDSSEYVIIASGYSFPDALAGGPLAYHYNAPILLARENKLSTETKDEIERLLASKAIILGGVAAVSEPVVDQLKDLGLTVERIGGNNRFETAALIAERLPSSQAVIANGYNFPDALAVAPYAAKNGVPILLTRNTEIPDNTKVALKGKTNTIIVGGHEAVDESLEELLPDPVRYSGVNRYETNKEIVEGLPLGKEHAYIATGQNFADALTGSVLAAKNDSPILLVRELLVPDSTASLLPNYGSYSIFGGEAAVSEIVRKEIDGEVASITARGISIGDTEKTVTTLLGKPDRIDESRDGYDWYIYNKNYSTYLQVGILNEKVVSLASNADVWESIFDVGIGSSLSDVIEKLGDQEEYDSYLIDDQYFIHFYYDELQHQNGEIVSLIQVTERNLDQVESAPSKKLGESFEKQLFDLANVARVKAGLSPYKWDDKVSDVARKHSQDMATRNSDSLYNPDLKELMSEAGIEYKSDLINVSITALYNPIEVHMIFLNRKDHRLNILNEEYERNGVGVAFGGEYGVYYTQIFYTP